MKPQVIDWHRPMVGADGMAHGYCGSGPEEGRRSPYGTVGDIIWVRETWQSDPCDASVVCYSASGHHQKCAIHGHLWRPSIHMPRWASRISLEIVSVRVERVQDITTNDAMAEGVDTSKHIMGDHRPEFMRLWNSINAKRGYGWDANPWVWVISFRRVK